MSETISLLPGIYLQPGSWADWLAAITSGIAVLIAAGSFGFERWLQRRHKRQAERDTARVIGIKLLLLFDSVKSIERYFDDRLQYSIADRQPTNLNMRSIPPLVGVQDDRVGDFDQQEMALLLATGDAEFINKLVNLISRHRGTLKSFEEYKARYLAFTQTMPPPVEVNGPHFVSEVTKEEYHRVAPLMAMGDGLIEGIFRSTSHEVTVVEFLAERYTPLMKRHFRVSHWFRITPPTEHADETTPLHLPASLLARIKAAFGKPLIGK